MIGNYEMAYHYILQVEDQMRLTDLFSETDEDPLTLHQSRTRGVKRSSMMEARDKLMMAMLQKCQ